MDKKTGLPRREFLKIAGISGLGALLPNWLVGARRGETTPTPAPIETSSEMTKWNLEQVLLRFDEVIDACVDYIQKQPGFEKYSSLKFFIDNFGPESQAQKGSMRNVLLAAFRQDAPQILGLDQRFRQLSCADSKDKLALGAVDVIPSLAMTHAFYPGLPGLLYIKDIQGLADEVWEAIRHLANLYNWFYAEHSVMGEPAKSIIIHRITDPWNQARQKAEVNKLWAKLDKEPSRAEGKRTVREKQIFDDMLSVFSHHFPGMLYRTPETPPPDFTSQERAYEDDTWGEFLNSDQFTQFTDALAEYRAMHAQGGADAEELEIARQWALESLDDFCAIFFHETGHRFDPRSQSDAWGGTLPQDYFQYLSRYADLFTDLQDDLHGSQRTSQTGLGGEEIEAYGYLNLVDGFGLDQMRTHEDVIQLTREFEDLQSIVQQLEDLGKAGQKLINKMGMEYFFGDRKELLHIWQELLQEEVITYPYPAKKGDKVTVRTLKQLLGRNLPASKLSAAHMQDIIKVLQNLQPQTFVDSQDYSEGQYQRRFVCAQLLKLKRTYALALHVLLDRLLIEGEVSPEKNLPLYNQALNLGAKFRWSLQHAMTGCFEYIKNAPNSIRQPLEQQAGEIATKNRSEIMQLAQRWKGNEQAFRHLEKLNLRIVQGARDIAQERAELWHAKASDGAEPYTAAFIDLATHFGLDSPERGG